MQSKVPNKISNSMADRTEGCISLPPRDTVTGSVKFLCLNSLREVTRDQWIELPIPDIVIKRINEMAEKQNRKLSKDPVFMFSRQRTVEKNDINDDENNLRSEENERVISINNKILPDDNLNDDIATDEQNNNIDDQEVDYNIHQSDLSHQQAEDGDIIMDDADTIFYSTKSNNITTNDETNDQATPNNNMNIHNYNLRQHRTNWKNKVFMTAAKIVNESTIKYVYRTSIKECKRTLGETITKAAIKKELQQMLDKNVFTPVHKNDVKDKKKIIPSMLFMKEKYNAEGAFEKLKARLVGMGNHENRDNYEIDDIFSPTVSLNSVFITAAIAAEEN